MFGYHRVDLVLDTGEVDIKTMLVIQELTDDIHSS